MSAPAGAPPGGFTREGVHDPELRFALALGFGVAQDRIDQGELTGRLKAYAFATGADGRQVVKWLRDRDLYADIHAIDRFRGRLDAWERWAAPATVYMVRAMFEAVGCFAWLMPVSVWTFDPQTALDAEEADGREAVAA